MGSMTELRKLCAKLKIVAAVKYGNNVRHEEGDDWRRTAHPWTVTLRRRDGDQRRTLTVPFWTGSAWTEEPDAADVLSALASDARSGDMTFGEFCSEFGYDEDSRKAESTWRACKALAPRVRRFLGDAFEAVSGAEH